jgi:uncharacterized protein
LAEKSGGFIKDPIHGYVRISQTERSIIDTEPVQRLKRIRQLAGSEFVYPAANHTRFEHVIGTMHLAGTLAEALPIGLPPDQREHLRLAALLHDIGHGPFSHVFESLLTKYLGKNHEDFTPWLVKETDIAEKLDAAGVDTGTMGRLAVGKLASEERPYLDQIISGSVDVDKLDYVVRDSFHTGAGYGSVDVHRLLHAMDVIDNRLSVDSSAVATLESFLLARFESFRTIYFHKASRAVQIMLVKALEAAREDLGLLDFDEPEDYLKLDDYKVWTELKECRSSKRIMEDLEHRKLLKCAYERTLFSGGEIRSNLTSDDRVRVEIEQKIARKAKTAREDVVIDLPTIPSVPYHDSATLHAIDIPVFSHTPTGRKEKVSLVQISKIAGVLRTFMNLVRVYTKESYRSKVETASRQILGEAEI